MQREVSATGCINRVEPKFAYLRSDYGSVFVPPSSALPSNCSDPDMTKYYRTGDVVHFTAIPQTGKNNCSLLATKINLSRNSCTYQNPGVVDSEKPTHLSNQLAMITGVNDTFAFARVDNLGQIFVPGGVYQSSFDESPRLTTHLSVGDMLLCDIRPQTEHNGCTWLALTATKVRADGDESQSQCPPIEASVQGFAIVQLVNETAAIAVSSEYGNIYCPILTWTAGQRSNSLADCLFEVLRVGETIHFVGIEIATESSQQWCCTLRAIRWGPVDVPLIIRKSVCDSSTQTVLRSDEMLVNALQRCAPDMLHTLRNKMPNLIDYCIQ